MEKVVTVGVVLKNSSKKTEYSSLVELANLVATANGVVVKEFLVKRDTIDPAYYIGKGKAEEIGEFVAKNNIHTVIFDNELTPAQLRNLEQKINCKIVDRTRLILDIFAQRAHTREAQLQVKLAQCEYLLPRLTKKGIYMDNQVGGIGTRGPGETKLEYDRRQIMQHIVKIKHELEKIKTSRELQKKQRIISGIPLVALIGYTNTGKSTLFNTLLKKYESYADDKLFATLDPLIRKVELPSGTKILIIDTVGFINKLPHHLVESFKSTLEVIKDASLLLEVIDVTSPNINTQTALVWQILTELSAQNIPLIKVYNKIDLLPENIKKNYIKKFATSSSQNSVVISAKTGFGIDSLIQKIEKNINKLFITKTIKIPLEKYQIVNYIYKHCSVLSNSVEKEHVLLKIKTTKNIYFKLKNIINSEL